MSSNRLIFLFLGIVLLVVVILSSKRIATTLRGWFGKYVPGVQTVEESPTPTITPYPTVKIVSPTPLQKKAIEVTRKSSPTSTIPSTGPETVVWLLLGGGVTGGIALRRIGSSILKKS